MPHTLVGRCRRTFLDVVTSRGEQARIRQWTAAAAVCAAVLGGMAAPAPAAPRGPAEAGEMNDTTMRRALMALPVADEDRSGYERSKFKHWIDEDGDQCSTRNEALLKEAIRGPSRGSRCSLSGGVWHSYYNNVDVLAHVGSTSTTSHPLLKPGTAGRPPGPRRNGMNGMSTRTTSAIRQFDRGDRPVEQVEGRQRPGRMAAAGPGRSLPLLK